MDLNFDKLYAISVFFMKLNRSHPYISRDVKWAVQFLLMHGIFTLVFCLLLYSTLCHDIKIKDYTQACANGILAVLYTVVTFKYTMMLWHQRLLLNLMETMKKDYAVAQNLSLEEQTLVLQYAIRGKWVTKLWLLVAACSAGLFPLKSVVLMLYYSVVDEFKPIPVYDLTYPDLIERHKDSPVVFIFLYIIMLCYAFYAMSMYIGLVPLGPIFMAHACSQLELIKRRMKKLYPDNGYKSEETMANIKDIVKLLQNIYRFVEDIQRFFQLIYEISMKGTMFTLPITCYQIIETFHRGQVSLEFITIVFGCVALTSCPCYYSDLLLETGDSVRETLYTSGWEKHWERRTRTMLLVVLTRTARPLAIRSMFRTVCLAALTDVYQQSYAIFNLLNAMWR